MPDRATTGSDKATNGTGITGDPAEDGGDGRFLPVPYRIALMYAAMFFGTGIATPFLPIWLASRGIGAGDIGLLLTVPPIIRIVSAPFVGWQADRHASHRALCVTLSALGVLAWAAVSQAVGFWLALGALALTALASNMTPLVESIALSGVRSRGHDYGRMRFWGSISFIAANLLSGWLLSRYGPSPLGMLMIVGATAALVVSLLLPQPTDLGGETTARRKLTWSSALAVLRLPMMPQLLLAAAMLQGAHGMYYTYGTLNWRTLGIDPRWFGALWAIGLVTEISLFWWSGRAVAWLGATGLVVLGATASIVRWSAMTFDPPMALLWPLQMLHGITFGACYLGTMHLLSRLVPPDRQATAQALYSLTSTLGTVGATALSAQIYPLAGGQAYAAMAVMSVIGLWAALLVARRDVERSSGVAARR